MKHSFLIFLLILVQSINFNVCAQSDIFEFKIINGKVVDKSTGNCIPSANIYNESNRHWEHANEKGEFKLWVDIGDTLMFSAIGYLSVLFFVLENQIKDSLVIELETRTYEIGEAVIKVPKKYSKFKQDFLNLYLPRTELDSIIEELAATSKQVIKQAEYDRQVKEVFDREKGTLFVLGAPIRTKEEKDQKKLKKISSIEEQQKLLNFKFNREIVKNYTKLDNNELTQFMIFCNFPNEFLLEANDYEIGEAIIKKYKEYQETQK